MDRLSTINETLYQDTKDWLKICGCNDNDIHSFLFDDSICKRRIMAKNVIENIIDYHGKSNFIIPLDEMLRIEKGMGELQHKLRDHSIHALLSFIFGIYLYTKFLENNFDEDFLFQWKLSSLLHDIGYPAQLAKEGILNPFTCKINKVASLYNQNNRVHFNIVPDGIDELTDCRNSFDKIQQRFDEWQIQINAKEEYNKTINHRDSQNSNKCHGIMGSLILLYLFDRMYHNYNPGTHEGKHVVTINTNRGERNFNFDRKYLNKDIVSVCAAIYLHNLDPDIFKTKIDRIRSPLAFLLILTDSLQQWDRPSYYTHKSSKAHLFRIELKDRKLYFSVPDNEKKGIINEIRSLDANDVIIQG